MNTPALLPSRLRRRARALGLGVTLALSATVLLPLAAVHAQSPVVNAASPRTTTITGKFKFTDGNSADTRRGTFATTVTASATGSTETTVYTDAANSQTRTATTVTTINADDSRSVDFTDVGFDGKTFHSTRTVSKIKGGHAGTGTFTEADGSGGAFTTLETDAEQVEVVSAVHDNTVHGQTHELRLTDVGLGTIVTKTSRTGPKGDTAVEVFTRTITSIQ